MPNKAINRGYWYDTVAQRRVFEKTPNAVWWDSALEHKLARKLDSLKLEYDRQYPVTVIPTVGFFPPKTWLCDFHIPSLGLYIECKGGWINTPEFNVEKREFMLLMHALAYASPSKFSSLYIVGDAKLSPLCVRSVDDFVNVIKGYQLCLG